jgi:RNA-directed DNA polymerase
LYKAIRDQASKNDILQIHNAIVQSFSARALSVRRVTTNGGRKTAGIDGIVYTTADQKIQAVTDLGNFNASTYIAKPVKRVLIPKGDGGKRPLGIPTM